MATHREGQKKAPRPEWNDPKVRQGREEKLRKRNHARTRREDGKGE